MVDVGVYWFLVPVGLYGLQYRLFIPPERPNGNTIIILLENVARYKGGIGHRRRVNVPLYCLPFTSCQDPASPLPPSTPPTTTSPPPSILPEAWLKVSPRNKPALAGPKGAARAGPPGGGGGGVFMSGEIDPCPHRTRRNRRRMEVAPPFDWRLLWVLRTAYLEMGGGEGWGLKGGD